MSKSKNRSEGKPVEDAGTTLLAPVAVDAPTTELQPPPPQPADAVDTVLASPDGSMKLESMDGPPGPADQLGEPGLPPVVRAPDGPTAEPPSAEARPPSPPLEPPPPDDDDFPPEPPPWRDRIEFVVTTPLTTTSTDGQRRDLPQGHRFRWGFLAEDTLKAHVQRGSIEIYEDGVRIDTSRRED
jgi:hypothetical protein